MLDSCYLSPFTYHLFPHSVKNWQKAFWLCIIYLMPFTNLNKKLDNTRSVSSHNNRRYSPSRSFQPERPKRPRNLKKMFIRIGIVLIILFVAIYLPIRGIYNSSRTLIASAKLANDAFKRENLDDVNAQVKIMESSSKSLNTSLNFLFWVRIIPVVGGYYADAQHFSKAASYELEAAQTIVESLLPSKQELGFTGQPTPGTDRVAQFVKILNKTLPQLDKVQPLLEKAGNEVASVDVNKYPENFGSRPVKSRIDAAKNLIGGVAYAVKEARPAIEQAPAALGEPTPKNYMLIFQNDKELRATGGFMTAYAFMKLDKGRLSASQSDDIYRLDEKLLERCKSVICPLTPPAAIAKYLPEADGRLRTAWSMRDSNFSPDVPTALTDFEKMYNFLPGAEKYDGIILMDTKVVEELITVTGPIEVDGTTFSNEIDKRCDCSKVIYELENYSQVIEKGATDRKAILGTLMQQILSRALGTSFDKVPEFINVGVKMANSKHIMMFMKEPKLEAALTNLNWTGQIKQVTDSDYLHINDSNFAGGKSNLYVRQKVDLDITQDGGKSVNKLTIQYRNPFKASRWLNNVVNRTYVRVYVPKGAKLLNSKGSDSAVTTIPEELGKTVFEAFVQVRPENTRDLVVEYELPANYTKDGKYPILIQKQGGVEPFEYNVKVNGKSKEKFELDGDKSLNLSL